MRHRRILLIFAGFFAALLLATYLVLQNTGASRAFATRVLSRFIRSRFDLGDAQIDATGRVRLHSLQIAHPRNRDKHLIDAGQVDVDVSTNPLGTDRIGTVRQITIDKLDLHLGLADDEVWDWREILDLSATDSAGVTTIPAITVRDSRCSIRLRADTPAVEFTGVALELLPEQPGSTRVTLRGSMVSPAGFSVQVSGRGDVAKPEFAILLESTGIPINAATARPYNRDVEQYLQAAHFGGTARKVGLWLQYPADTSDSGVVSAKLRAEVEGIECVAPEVPYPVAAAAGSITASTNAGGQVRFDLTVEDQGARIHARGELQNCLEGAPRVDVHASATTVPVDERLAAALSRIEASRRVWVAFAPRGGRADAELSLRNSEPGQAPDLALDLTLHGVSGSFEGFPSAQPRPPRFPYRIGDMDGVIQVRPGRVLIHNLSGQRSEGGRVQISGSVIELGPEVEPEIDLRIEGQGLEFSDELRGGIDAILAHGAAVYDEFAPAGRCDATVTVRKTRDRDTAAVDVLLQPRDCSASYVGFPCRVHHLGGTIAIGSEAVDFALQGNRGDSVIAVGGHFALQGNSRGPDAELWVDATRLQLDDEMHAAVAQLDAKLAAWWQALLPTGAIDGKLSLWRAAQDVPFEHDLRIDLAGGALTIPALQQELRDLSGRVFVHGSAANNRVDVSMVRGTLASASSAPPHVLIEGNLQVGDTDALDVTAVVRDLELDDALSRALDAANALSLRTWHALAPAGEVDLVTRLHRPAGAADVAQTMRVLLRGVRSSARFLPSPATELRGEVTIIDGVGSFDEIHGRIADTEIVFTAGAFGRRGDDTVIEATLNADRLQLDPSFANLLTGPLRDTFLQRQVRGAVRIDRMAMLYSFPTDSDQFALQLRGDVVADNVAMTLGVPVDDISGVWHVTDSDVSPAGGRVTARAQGVSFNSMGHRCHDLNAVLSVTAADQSLAITDLSVSLHGGRVVSEPDTPAVRYHFADGRSEGKLRWEGIRLSELLAAMGRTDAPRGTVSGHLGFEHPGTPGVIDLVARGAIDINNSRLGEVPLFTKLYSYVAPEHRPQFDTVHVEFDMAAPAFHISNLMLRSPLLRIEGSGNIGFDGYLDIELLFPDLFASAADWLILPRMLHIVTSQVVNFHLGGYLRSPRITPRLMFQADAARRQIPPLPPPSHRIQAKSR